MSPAFTGTMFPRSEICHACASLFHHIKSHYTPRTMHHAYDSCHRSAQTSICLCFNTESHSLCECTKSLFAIDRHRQNSFWKHWSECSAPAWEASLEDSKTKCLISTWVWIKSRGDNGEISSLIACLICLNITMTELTQGMLLNFVQFLHL